MGKSPAVEGQQLLPEVTARASRGCCCAAQQLALSQLRPAGACKRVSFFVVVFLLPLKCC